jgi:precorrin-6x reductase
MTIVILGGTAEARQLAAALVGAGIDVVSTLAGRVKVPSCQWDVSGQAALAASTASLTSFEPNMPLPWWTRPTRSRR